MSDRAEEKDLLRRILGRVKDAFYAEDEKGFYRDLRMLRLAATWPAQFIREWGTGRLDEERYESIFCQILRGVKEHGPGNDGMRCKAAYLTKAIQDHWRRHSDEYLHQSKTAAGLADRARRGKVREIQDILGTSEVERLAQIHEALKTGRPKKSKARSSNRREIQEELFKP